MLCRWPRELLVEKALTLEERNAEDRRKLESAIEYIDNQVGKRSHTKTSERLEQLKKWVSEMRERSGVATGEEFVCPKPQNRQGSHDIEAQLGGWINSKIHSANKSDPKVQNSREKAILLLNGPIAEILGRSGDNWWLEEKPRVGRPKKTQTHEHSKRPKRKRKYSGARSSLPDHTSTGSPGTISIKSSRGRQVKPSRLSDYAY